MLVEVPEVERRQNHISQVDPNHSLLPIALNCLKDKDSKRPSAHQLCERVADLKRMPKYIDSTRTVQEKDKVFDLKPFVFRKMNVQYHQRRGDSTTETTTTSQQTTGGERETTTAGK